MDTQREPLDERKQRILKAVVHEHVETAEPVGSESLVQHYDFGVRSATIRNELAELSELGYLKQPHTSAGRVPSDRGYRFYVDRLMEPAHLRKQQVQKVKEQMTNAAAELEAVLTLTCRILTGMTRYTSVVTQPLGQESLISHVGLSKITTKKLLLVVVLSDGRVEHRIVDMVTSPSDNDVLQVANLLNTQFLGVGLESARLLQPYEDARSITYNTVFIILKQVLDVLSGNYPEVYVEGTNHVIRQPEFKEITKLEIILDALEERKQLYQLLSRVVLGPDVTVIIGTENPYKEMCDMSFIAARYSIGGRTAGTIGVLGPTRMDYRRAVAAVQVMAENLSELLTKLSLS